MTTDIKGITTDIKGEAIPGTRINSHFFGGDFTRSYNKFLKVIITVALPPNLTAAARS